MSRNEPSAHALTANRLADGAVIYLGADGAWTTDIRNASVAHDDAAAAGLSALGQKAVEAARVVGPYLIAVADGPEGLRPASLRERIRAEGLSAPVAAAVAEQVAQEPPAHTAEVA